LTPLYGKALKRMLLGEAERVGGAVGGARVEDGLGEGEWLGGVDEEELELEMVVWRCACVVSVEGGGGRWLVFVGEKTLARQRKHSPVPK
jgi:hypothetical protein